MKNTVIKYPNISCRQFTAQDYTDKKFKQILDLPELTDSTYVEHIELLDNQTIEQISYILYGSPDFWDILVLINNMDPLFSMSYDFDIIKDISKAKVQKYLEGYSGMYKNDTEERLDELVLHNNIEANEKRRTIRVIKKDRLGDFLKILNGIDFEIRNYIELNYDKTKKFLG